MRRQQNSISACSGKTWAILIIVALSLVRAGAVHLLQGQSTTILINGLIEERPSLTNSTCQEIGEVLVRFQSDLLLPTETIRIELFESGEAEVPFSSMDRSGLGNGTGALGTFIISQWQDLHGVVRLTMLSGSVNVNEVYVSIQNSTCGVSTNTVDSPTPPRIECPSPAEVDCTNNTPLVVTVENLSGDPATVWWNVDGVTVQTNFISAATNELAFLSALPLGLHNVIIVASNALFGTLCATDVTVVDRSPPVLLCPPNPVVEFVDETGAQVGFTVETGDCDTNVVVTSVPPSGSVFPIGSTVVQSSATDTATNLTQCEFTVTVLGARGVISNLVAELTLLHDTQTERIQRRRLEIAIERLNDALESDVFLDETHLARPGGGTSFRQHQRVYSRLRQWMRRARDPVLEEVAQNAIDRMLRADRLLAAVAIQDATNAGGVATRIAAAKVDLATGDLNDLRGREPRALANYRAAWIKAGRAVR